MAGPHAAPGNRTFKKLLYSSFFGRKNSLSAHSEPPVAPVAPEKQMHWDSELLINSLSLHVHKQVTTLTADCQILFWKDFPTPSIVHLPAKGDGGTHRCKWTTPARSFSAELQSCHKILQKQVTEPTGLTWTLLLHNLHPKLLLTAVSHIRYPCHSSTRLTPKSVCVYALLCITPDPHSGPRAFTFLLPLQNLSSYRRVGTGKSGKSYSIPPQFAAEDAIALTWYFNTGKCWKCIPKIWEISNIPPAENLLPTLPCCLPSLK